MFAPPNLRCFAFALLVVLAPVGAKAATVIACQDASQADYPASPQHPCPVTSVITNPSSTLTLPASTTAYTAGWLIASSATPGSIVVPSFPLPVASQSAAIPRLRLLSNDSTSTGWGGQTIQVDLWTTAPTFVNGDRGAWLVATGSAAHVAAYSCVMAAVQSDGVFGSCSINVGSFAAVKLSSGTSVYWTLEAVTGSGVTGANKIFTLVPELVN